MKRIFAIGLLLISQLNFTSDELDFNCPRQLHYDVDGISFFVGFGICMAGACAAASATRKLQKNPNDDYLRGVQVLGCCTFIAGCGLVGYAYHRAKKYNQMQQFESLRADELFISFQAGEIDRLQYHNGVEEIEMRSMLEAGEFYVPSR